MGRVIAPIARWVALIVLVVGFVAFSAEAHPRDATYADFRHDLERGAVTQLIIPSDQWTQDNVRSGTWSTRPFRWRTGRVLDRPEGAGPSPSGTSEGTAGSPWSDFANDMEGRDVRLRTTSDDDSGSLSLPFPSSPQPDWTGLLISIAWLATFAAVFVFQPRRGNRWAWFWMFTIGQIGALLYLILEPEPLIRRAPALDRQQAAVEPNADGPDTATPPTSRPLSGAQGFGLAIVSAIATAMASVAIGWLAGRMLP
ncbi:hypothetical protein [Tsukamurella pseudospumae]|uniref:Peptidase M41 FtsH extracellular domain-containing protein n=1 Tax=Tsukamurella pseudospumae TaxID=239498 RepID=A0A137Z721_9ACTN|nr:hypothetical protein [Tsukamurella pseudospumae]KXO93963.1 hypothetical protein AXK61_05385 [Tsukamurella pseudospumae]